MVLVDLAEATWSLTGGFFDILAAGLGVAGMFTAIAWMFAPIIRRMS